MSGTHADHNHKAVQDAFQRHLDDLRRRGLGAIADRKEEDAERHWGRRPRTLPPFRGPVV